MRFSKRIDGREKNWHLPLQLDRVGKRTHMAWTEENSLNVPSVCLASVMERKEARR